MSVNQKIHLLKLSEWTARFSEQKASGLSAKQRCVQNGFSIHAYNYWKHLLKEELAGQLLPDIVPLPLPAAPAESLPSVPVQVPGQEVRVNCATARLMIGDASIEVDDQVSEAFLLSLIKAVRHA